MFPTTLICVLILMIDPEAGLVIVITTCAKDSWIVIMNTRAARKNLLILILIIDIPFILENV
jgi:hypothetical protein